MNECNRKHDISCQEIGVQEGSSIKILEVSSEILLVQLAFK